MDKRGKIGKLALKILDKKVNVASISILRAFF
jgi:hypothetical protein